MNDASEDPLLLVADSSEAEDDWNFAFADAVGTFDATTDVGVDSDAKKDGPQSTPITFSQQNHPLTTTSSSTNLLPPVVFDDIPLQLHPAVSLGVQRVSSCYFSLGSTTREESMVDLLSQLSENKNKTEAGDGSSPSSPSSVSVTDDDSDIFYHDILMHVLGYLDAATLASFSATGRRPNFEVFYFLQLQLQQALLLAPPPSSCNENREESEQESTEGTPTTNSTTPNLDDNLSSTLAGCASVTRLATLDYEMAKQVIEGYLDSNSTLRTLPLSHSLVYARQYLLHRMFPDNGNSHDNTHKTLASAALFMTVVGAASLASISGAGDTASLMAAADSLGNELPNVLFRVGFVGSLMGAARQISDTEHRAAMREKAEQMASMIRGNQQEQDTREGQHESTSSSSSQSQFRFPSLVHMRQRLQETLRNLAAKEEEERYATLLPNPYDHLPAHHEENECQGGDENSVESLGASATGTSSTQEALETSQQQEPLASDNRKMPSGCVGAYYRAIQNASHQVTQLIKERRKAKFDALSVEEQRQLSIEFLTACSSNDSLDRVKEMTPYMDVDGFFFATDGTETKTCALHRAAFSGADKVIEFLCTGIDDRNERLDGGLCDVNCKDANNWVALHFAAGANSVEAIRVLVRHGADLQVEAINGYSPYNWALRLSNEEVANELMEQLINKSGTNHRAWISGQPLTSIANRFFSLIPTNS